MASQRTREVRERESDFWSQKSRQIHAGFLQTLKPLGLGGFRFRFVFGLLSRWLFDGSIFRLRGSLFTRLLGYRLVSGCFVSYGFFIRNLFRCLNFGNRIRWSSDLDQLFSKKNFDLFLAVNGLAGAILNGIALVTTLENTVVVGLFY